MKYTIFLLVLCLASYAYTNEPPIEIKKLIVLTSQSRFRTTTLNHPFHQLDRSQIVGPIGAYCFENNESKVEHYTPNFKDGSFMCYSYFHKGVNAGLLQLSDPQNKQYLGDLADFEYLKEEARKQK